MKKSRNITLALLFCSALPIAACGNQGNPQEMNLNRFNHPAPLHAMDRQAGSGMGALNDPGVIPNHHGPKTDTTNERGRTTSGMGMSVYSLIGSSSLHEGGVSSHIRSRIAGQGIEGVDVFVLDDTVILATEKRDISSNQYDTLQNEVLSQTEGMSGKGAPYEGTSVHGDAADDNLTKAKRQVEAMFDGRVNVVTVEDRKATELIRDLKSRLSSSVSAKGIGKDISSLLEMADKK